MLECCLDLPEANDDVITQWSDSICESMTSQSLLVQLRTFPQQPKRCEIESILLSLKKRIQSFSVFLDNHREDRQRVIPRLYEACIVTE